jgi:Tfp pilus assembly protein PilO
MSKLKQNSWLVTVPLGIAAIAYVTLFFLPAMKAVAEIRQNVSGKQDYIAQAERMRPHFDNTVKSLEEVNQYTSHWQGRLIEASQLPVIYGQISRLAKSSGAVTNRFEPQHPIKYKSFDRVPLALAITGTFTEIQTFLQGLESLPAVIWVDEVKMNGTGKDTQDMACEMNLTIFTNCAEKSD